MSGLRVTEVRTTILDVPIRRPHRFAGHAITSQAYLLVQLHTDAGVVGVGEGVSPGGPWWSGESIEGQKTIIDRYLAPTLVGMGELRLPLLGQRLERVAHGNEFAKAAVEMAAFDAVGRALGVPVHTLLGGAARAEIPVRWALSGHGHGDVVAEARQRLDTGHRALKLKLGALPPEEDLRRVELLIDKIGTGVDYLADPNGAWDFRTAVWALAELEAMGVRVVEQPIDRDDVAGMAALVERATTARIMADESVCRPVEALRAAHARSCDAVSVKAGKAGGLRPAMAVAAIATAAGMDCYGGTALETSVGTAAAAHLFASLPRLPLGCELVGPLLLADDIVTEPLRYADGALRLPPGPGLGVEVDPEKVARYARTAPR